MHFIYHNMCEDEDVVSRMYEWNDDKIEKLYYKNCPVLYRIRDGQYGPILPSPKHFQSQFVDGVFNDTPQQTQPQHTFLPSNGEFWLYENINDHLLDLCSRYSVEVKEPLLRLNKSPGDTKQLIKHFFTPELIESIQHKYAEDFELYERLKDVSTGQQI